MTNIRPAVIAAGFGGSILLYSGLKGKGVANSIRALLTGQSPSIVPDQYGIGGSITQAADVPTEGQVSVHNVTSGSAASNQNIARLLAAPYGWSAGQQWTDLVALWNQESSWNEDATGSDTPQGNAYGIVQALPSSKLPLAGRPNAPDGPQKAAAQIQWGLQYISKVYGNPSAAWAHETSAGWY